jgi:hypothetical protein
MRAQSAAHSEWMRRMLGCVANGCTCIGRSTKAGKSFWVATSSTGIDKIGVANTDHARIVGNPDIVRYRSQSAGSVRIARYSGATNSFPQANFRFPSASSETQALELLRTIDESLSASCSRASSARLYRGHCPAPRACRPDAAQSSRSHRTSSAGLCTPRSG